MTNYFSCSYNCVKRERGRERIKY